MCKQEKLPSRDKSTIGGGANNTVSDSTGETFIGAGEDNSSSGFRGFIGAGLDNQINALPSIWGAGFLTGDNAGILAGQGLIAQSFSQTVLGYNNIPQGGSVDPTHIFPSDRLFIIGNGRSYDSASRHNAFEVTYDGKSIVYDTNGTGGAENLPGIPGNGAVYGERCQDNTPIAWGDVTGRTVPTDTCITHADYGIDSVQYKGLGQYGVYLHAVDPHTGNRITFHNGFCVTATPVAQAPGIPLARIVQVSELGWNGLPSNAFELFVSNGSTSVDGQVMFQVFGRQ